MTIEITDEKSRYMAIAIAAGAVGPQSVIIAPLLVSSLISGLQIQSSVAGLIMSAELMMVSIASFAIAPRINRLSPRYVVLVGALIAIMGHLASIYTSDTTLLLFVRSVAGIGAGLALAGGNACGASMRDPDRVYSLVVLMTGLAHLLLLSIGPLFVGRWSYGGAYGMQALLVFLLIPFLFWLPTGCSGRRTASPEFEGKQQVSLPLALAICAAVILFFAHNGAVWAFSQEIGRNIGISDQQIGLILGITGFICLVGAVAAAVLSTRFGRLLPLLLGVFMSLVLGVSILLTDNAIVYTICQTLYQAAIFFTVPYLFGLAASLDFSGGIVAAAGGGLTLGSALGPGIAGILIQMGGYPLVALFVVVSLLIVALLAGYVHDKVRRREITEVVS